MGCLTAFPAVAVIVILAKLTHQPAVNQRDKLIQLRGGQRLPLGDGVKARQAGAAAGAGGMLGAENRVTTPRRLAPVVRGTSRRQAAGKQVVGMLTDRLQPALRDERAVGRLQVDARTESTLRNAIQPLVHGRPRLRAVR